jgi:membrane protein implicated in regulation of membrane protease activity
MVSAIGSSPALWLVIGGILLIIAEGIAPGAHFIVLGVALLGAGIVGITIGTIFPPIAGPIALAILVLLFGAVALFGYRELDLYGEKGTAQTATSDSLTGRTGRVTEEVTETAGEVKINNGGFNPYYSARTSDGTIPEGTEVIVIDPGGGNVVTVETLEMIEDDIDRELAKGRQHATETEQTEESTRDNPE